MEEINYGYEDQQPSENRSAKGYKIIIIVLAVILVAVSGMFMKQTNDLKQAYAIERAQLTNEISTLVGQYDSLRVENDTLAYNMNLERNRADSLLQKLSEERTLNRAKIRQYEKELGTLRTVMRSYVHQIDSLSTINKGLVAENTSMRTQVATQRRRADIAEERAQEQEIKLRQGAVIKARDISLVALSRNDRVVERASRAVRLRVDLVLSGNALARPGERPVYVRITGPDGYIMTDDVNKVFDYEGEMRTYSASRDVDYQLEDLPVGILYNGGGITEGKYLVEVYMDGHLVGSSEVFLR